MKLKLYKIEFKLNFIIRSLMLKRYRKLDRKIIESEK